MNRPFVGSGLNPTKVDHATDAWDTIDWLVKHVPESNGKVGILGISYDGFTALAALVNPHPALAVAVPMNPMVDGWRGDDWFHNGAFRLMNASYVWEQVAHARQQQSLLVGAAPISTRNSCGPVRPAGWPHRRGLEQIGFWRNLVEHPAYDTWWQAQAMDLILAKQPLKVPVMLVHSLWDQEDIYGATAVYRAIEPLDTANDKVFLTLGPWFHGQQIEQASALGRIKWDQDTAKMVALACAGAIPGALPEGRNPWTWRPVDCLPERQQRVAAPGLVARSSATRQAVSETRCGAGVRGCDRTCADGGICVGSGPPGQLRAATGARCELRGRPLDRLAGWRPAQCRCPTRCAELRVGGADHQRDAGGHAYACISRRPPAARTATGWSS